MTESMEIILFCWTTAGLLVGVLVGYVIRGVKEKDEREADRRDMRGAMRAWDRQREREPRPINPNW